MRAMSVSIPHIPSSESISNSVENSSGPNAVSTVSLTLRPFADGETADQLGSQYPPLNRTGSNRATPVPAGCYRLHANVPNWAHVLVRQDYYFAHPNAEVPVWLDPATGKIMAIDKEGLVEYYESRKAWASEIWSNPSRAFEAADGAPSVVAKIGD